MRPAHHPGPSLATQARSAFALPVTGERKQLRESVDVMAHGPVMLNSQQLLHLQMNNKSCCQENSTKTVLHR